MTDDGSTRGSAPPTLSNWGAILVRAGKRASADNLPMLASALAYSAFFAIPSVLLVVLGVFTLVADRETVAGVVDRLTEVAPPEAATLFGDSLDRMTERPVTSVLVTVLGFVLAIWSMTSAMTSCMTALNLAYELDEGRGFARKRLTALALSLCVGGAAVLTGALLILGPHLERWLGTALDAEHLAAWVWWAGQWPILILGLLGAFSAVMYLGPDLDDRRGRVVTPGAAVAAAGWLAVSAGFAAYTASFGSYEKTWGSLTAVIVTLTWLWLGGLALLFGGEVNAEVERSRRLRDA
jgi:membrane protein